MMNATTFELASAHCASCESGLNKLSEQEIRQRLDGFEGWEPILGGRRMRKFWRARDFRAGMKFLDDVAELAEQEGHHPDLHLEGYRNVWIALSTHAAGGLTENDFILAAKIDRAADRPELTQAAPKVGQA